MKNIYLSRWYAKGDKKQFIKQKKKDNDRTVDENDFHLTLLLFFLLFCYTFVIFCLSYIIYFNL